MQRLPVDEVIPELLKTLSTDACVVIQAPPGSGKTTRIAPSLLGPGVLEPGKRVYLLQPRRVAAKATAERIAQERGWQLGHQVGYQVRFESRVSNSTRLIVATDGILLRRLNDDPLLEDVGAVVLDEFHERSLNSDLLLAMLRRIQSLLREDLKLVAMSATLEAEALQTYLSASTIETQGTLFPVDIDYQPPAFRQNLVDHVVKVISRAATQSSGDLLVFLPGVGEISRVQRDLAHANWSIDFNVLPLHGGLSLADQSEVLAKSNKRKIVLSTNVAETSLTIDGITTVIDSGQVRVMRFNPTVGLNRLQLEPICQSSATQRAGRAGRVAPGQCIRLWDASSQRARPEFLDPEIRRVDVSSAVLQVMIWGENPVEFPWFEPPRADAIANSMELLERLGAIENGTITELGRQMGRLPLPPRLSRLLLGGKTDAEIEILGLAAAMLGERDPFIRQNRSGNRLPAPTRAIQRWQCDITERVNALNEYHNRGVTESIFGEIHRGAAKSIQAAAKQIVSMVRLDSHVPGSGAQSATAISESIGRALLAAFPDRLAKRRKHGDPRGKMVGGRGVKLQPFSGVGASELFLCIDVDDAKTEAHVRVASGVERSWLPQELLDERNEHFFNPTRKQVEARRRTYFCDLMLEETNIAISDTELSSQLLRTEAARQLPSIMPPESDPIHGYIQRLIALREWAPELELPTMDDKFYNCLLQDLCRDKRSFAELRNAPWIDWLKGRLSAEQQSALERECPEKLQVPSGSRIRLDYAAGSAPVLSVRIQEIFSWVATPRIAFGRVPILLHLLGPNYRPQQVTDDLASFWKNTYPVIRKELRRRYPKHAWPEDPLAAQPECKGGRSSK